MIHILRLAISQIDRAGYETLYGQSSPERKKQADRYRRQEDKLRCVAADALLRYAVRQALTISEFTVEQDPFGKPYVKDAKDFHYNLSHSGKWVVIAYGGSQVGIDIEQILMDSGKEDIARRYFTNDEQAYIFDATGSCRAKRFFRIWTGKESYLKYLGTGLRRALDSFSVLPDGAHLGVRLSSTLWDGYCLTLCTKDENATIKTLTLQELSYHVG